MIELSVEPNSADLYSRRIRVASVPSGHVYVKHLAPVQDDGAVLRLPDPVVKRTSSIDSQWWPPAMLDARWIVDNAATFDIFHIQFGFDALGPGALVDIVSTLRELGKPLVYTVHDLRNPHHSDPAAHEAQLDVLVPAADELITLTRGAATAIQRRWSRAATVIPHPHVIPLAEIRPRRAPTAGRFVVGVHAKSLRASMDPLATLRALSPLLAELPHLQIQVNVHHDVVDTEGKRHDAELAGYLHEAPQRMSVRVHDYFSDAELWSYLSALDASILPYRFGTHSGWLEACFDLGTTVIAPTCGFYSEQQPCLLYRHDETRLDAESLRDAVREAYSRPPRWQATRSERIAQRAAICRSHASIYQRLVSG